VTEDLICPFHVGDLFLGVGVHHVQEVLRHQGMTAVPWAPPSISGLVNLRGQIVTVIDLRTRFQLPPRPEATPSMGVIVRVRDQVLSLMVDRVDDVVCEHKELLERPPHNLNGLAREVIKGIYKMRERLLLVLDLETITAIPGARTARVHQHDG
jgi:purine-binding chemotaxis protein CheW